MPERFESTVGAPRPRVLYISYDGASEPLGRSQVVAYLVRLAQSCEVTLISFEKAQDDPAETRDLLAAAGVRWIPLRYHRRPAVLSTAWDILRGAASAGWIARRQRTQIVHVRSYVPAVMALLSARRRSWSLLFDIRGFWVDERVEGGLWPPGGLLFRLGKRCERWLFNSADAVVTLTNASLPQIREWVRERSVPVRVIPTCVALERYANENPAPKRRAVWCGSIGNFYRFGIALSLVDELRLPLTVFTRQVALAREATGRREAEVRTASPESIPESLCPGDIGLCIGRDGFANLARAPTRFAEYLAAGMMVAVTPGIGDLDTLVDEHRVGAILRSEGEEDLRQAAARLLNLAADPGAPARARALAAQLFDVNRGARAYRTLYAELLADGPADPVVSEHEYGASELDPTPPQS